MTDTVQINVRAADTLRPAARLPGACVRMVARRKLCVCAPHAIAENTPNARASCDRVSVCRPLPASSRARPGKSSARAREFPN